MDDFVPSFPGEREAEPESGSPRAGLRLVQGGGHGKPLRIQDRNDLARVLVGTAGDLLLRRISAPRAHEVEQRVERLMELFDRLEGDPALEPDLRRQLDELESLIRESSRRRPARDR